ncbi:MAG: trigger factor [Deltaproteobacteria bacterium]|nr:trigger factor [Deltaproteobacteria bacterium]
MEVQVEKLSPVLMELQIQVPADKVASEVEGAINSLQKTARVRGFRPGKAPRQVVVQLYGQAVRADVARRLMDSTLQQALGDKGIQPLNQPTVEPAQLESKKPFSFKARFEVRPEIVKVDWKGLAATKPSVAVTDESVKTELERLQRQHSTLQAVDGRGAQKGDVANLTLRFTIEGQERNETVETEIGEGKVMDSIEAALPGSHLGDEKSVTVSFPENHHAPQLRGKDVVISVKVDEVKERILPAIDDELAKDAGSENLAALESSIRERLGKSLEQRAEEEVAKALVVQLCEKNTVPVPPSLVEQQSRMTEREMQMMAQMAGQPYRRTSELLEHIRVDSEMKVRAGLLMAEIAKDNKLEVTEEDIEKGYQELAEQSGKNVARVRAEYRERGKREMLIGMILEDKVLTLIEKEATITPA